MQRFKLIGIFCLLMVQINSSGTGTKLAIPQNEPACVLPSLQEIKKSYSNAQSSNVQSGIKTDVPTLPSLQAIKTQTQPSVIAHVKRNSSAVRKNKHRQKMNFKPSLPTIAEEPRKSICFRIMRLDFWLPQDEKRSQAMVKFLA